MLAQGATPLLRAARAGDADFVALLLEYGALVDLPNKDGITPLMAAAGIDFGARVTRGRNRTDEGVLATLRLLIEAGADVNARMVTEARGGGGGRGSQVPSAFAVPHQTALHGAASRGFTAFAEFLASNGADLWATDANGRTPLDLAQGGVGGRGRGGGQGDAAFPETAVLLESLMAADGIPPASPE
jgi:ankyrin repeat protein